MELIGALDEEVSDNLKKILVEDSHLQIFFRASFDLNQSYKWLCLL